MKKISLVSLASLFFLLLCSSVAYLLRFLTGVDATVSLLLGGGVLLLSGILCFFLRKSRGGNILCFFLSAVAMGALLRAWHLFRGLDNSFLTLLLVSLAAVLYLALFFSLTQIPLIRGSKHGRGILFLLFFLLSLGLYLYTVFHTETNYVSTFGYYMLLELAFLFAMARDCDTADDLIRNLTLSTYSVLIVALIAAGIAFLAALGGDLDCDCDGDGACDCCDCFDGCSCSSTNDSKKRREK